MLWRNKIFSILEYREDTDDYIIKNIIACNNQYNADVVAKTYGDTFIAIETTMYLVDMNDTYKNGKFFNKDGEEIVKELTESEKIQLLEQKVAFLESVNKNLTNSLSILLDNSLEEEE